MNTDHSEHLTDDELAVLQHVREHSSAEPSAAVDALILAAAHAATQQSVAPSRWQRIQHWLLAGGHAQRWSWSVGVAGVASLALGLSLTWRHVEQPVAGFDQAPPMAIQSAAPKAMQQAKVESVEMKKQQPAAPVAAKSADRVAPGLQYNLAPAPQGQSASASARAMVPVDKAEEATAKAQAGMSDAATPAAAISPLREALLQVLALRRSGATQAADAELTDLVKRYPQQDVVAQLQQLERDMPQSKE